MVLVRVLLGLGVTGQSVMAGDPFSFDGVLAECFPAVEKLLFGDEATMVMQRQTDECYLEFRDR